MKIADSGMPEETYWESLLDIPLIVQWLKMKSISGPVVEIGCGYGTFTIPLAKETSEQIYAFDIEPSMIERTQDRARHAGVSNVKCVLRDVVEEGTGLQPNSTGLVLLFNILHFSGRRVILEEASRTLRPSGVAAVIHWRRDIPTPRGPAPALRPDQRVMLDAIAGLDLVPEGEGRILAPYHWGMRFLKKGIS